jgi:signal transduction histidine kinase
MHQSNVRRLQMLLLCVTQELQIVLRSESLISCCLLHAYYQVMRELREALHQKTDENRFIAVSYNFDPECHFIVDQFRLRQILLNYATNALKYTEKGEIVVTACLADNDTVVEFSVKDTGRGIKEADRDKIFKAFTTVKASDAARHSSQGLGLYLVSMLADRMGCKVGFDSVENVGSTFWLKIPYESVMVHKLAD